MKARTTFLAKLRANAISTISDGTQAEARRAGGPVTGSAPTLVVAASRAPVGEAPQHEEPPRWDIADRIPRFNPDRPGRLRPA